MHHPPFAGGPLWELAFRDSTEVGACFTFWSVAYMAGHHRRINNGFRHGNVGFRDRYRAVHVGQNPEGVLGNWTLKLTENVRVPRPGRRGDAFPPTVMHELVVLSNGRLDAIDGKPIDPPVAGLFHEEEFRRPPLIVHVPDDGVRRAPTVEMATPTEMLNSNWSTGIRELARYATWLAIAQQTLMQQQAQSELAS